MAYVAAQKEEDLSEPVRNGVLTAEGGDTSNITSAGSDGQQAMAKPVAITSSVGAPEPAAASTTKDASPRSGMFTNLSSYLQNNQAGAQALGNRTAGAINTEVGNAGSAIKGAGEDFRNQVQANTKTYNSDLATKASKDASQYVNNADLQAQLSGGYAGPKDLASTEKYAKAQEALNKATTEAQLAGSAGGQQELIRQTAAQPLTTGGTAFDQFLLQGTAPALGALHSAAETAKPLAGQLTQTTADAASQALAAQQQNEAVKAQTLGQLTQGTTGLLADLQTRATAQQAQEQAKSDALKQFLASGQGDATQALAGLGLSADQYKGLQTGNDALKQFGQAPIDLSKYYNPLTGQLGTGNVATAADKANLAALGQLTGTQAPQLNTGTLTPGSFDFNTAGAVLAGLLKNSAPGTPVPVQPPARGGEAPVNDAGGAGGAGSSGSSSSGTSATSGPAGGPAVGPTGSQVAAVIGAIAAPTPASIANAIAAIAAVAAANAAANAANADTDSSTNGSATNGATATDGPNGTGGAAAAAAAAAADAASTSGASAAAAAAAGQAAADAAVSGASAAAAAAAGAAAAAATDGVASADSSGDGGGTGVGTGDGSSGGTGDSGGPAGGDGSGW